MPDAGASRKRQIPGSRVSGHLATPNRRNQACDAALEDYRQRQWIYVFELASSIRCCSQASVRGDFEFVAR
jgi:hypothetical protein